MTSFDLTTIVNASPEVVFDLSRSIDVHAASMAESKEEAVGGVTEGVLELGEEVTWRARHFGFTFHMTSRLTEADRPNRFVDEQIDGPFKTWWHLHRFESTRNGTRMIDSIAYQPPFGPLGWLFDKLVLRRHMVNLITERNRYIKEAAESMH